MSRLKYRMVIENSKKNLRFPVILSVLAAVIVFANSCFEPYIANIEDEPDLISIEGSIIKGNVEQKVYISKTTSILNANFSPVRGCSVSVLDNAGNEFTYEENSDGTYSLIIPDEMLVYNRMYQLKVTTPEGEEYESSFKKLNQGIDVDSVYYEIEERTESYSGENLTGLQFYIDVQAPDSLSRYFRWTVNETYEFTSVGPISYFYYDKSLQPIPPEDSWAVYRCWKGGDIQETFLSNTINLSANEKKKIPLNYVSNEDEKLLIKYSLLVSQYMLDEDTYNYFLLNKLAEGTSGGLYTQQPGQPITNIENINNSSERVLGYFWVSSRSLKRIMVPKIKELEVHPNFCAIEGFNMEDHGDGPFPLYIMVDLTTNIPMTGGPYCFDCTKRGGSTTRPDYWN